MNEQHPLLALAEAIAVVAHEGAWRKGDVGEPYINHVRRVAERQTTWRRKVLGFLHDGPEDNKQLTFEILSGVGYPFDILVDLRALTRHIAEDDETYAEYIERLIREGSDDVLFVKLADLCDNLPDSADVGGDLPGRYTKAKSRIIETMEARGIPLPSWAF